LQLRLLVCYNSKDTLIATAMIHWLQLGAPGRILYMCIGPNSYHRVLACVHPSRKSTPPPPTTYTFFCFKSKK
jgi:hypothetical protein